MTAARDRLAEAVAAALLPVTGPYRRLNEVLTDALLPVVEQIAAEKAAEELRAAYWATAAIPDPESVRDVVRARAAALAPDGGEQQ